ncbi:thiamine pyrophosphate-dependent dehydrogenase E1 component subunit alpha [Amycolatopsis benzoatilytica]|uniref:thiamine pyrophosphate-dependent dehydrogenase E1 component subunit alpha n=1 Tax=Amycolatopsis benzoatilytica TaxID=346045 RepID=UPI000381F4EB|nr:thiamine pyrophosphate-dependent dehydrogenase E1 component subunit alpha [Amycolatopsis benzoatilytica]
MTSVVTSTGTAPIDGPTALQLYESMVRVRQFDEYARRIFLQGAEGFRGALHDGIGQEAVSAGVVAALRPDDPVVSSHRGHGQVIAKGAPLKAAFAEILGRSTGLCGGKGGSMHLTSVEHGHFGCSGIIGAQLLIANGIALGAQLTKSDQIAVAFFGDGGTNIGGFHEALNLAALWKLPVLFICENNQYMEQTRGDVLTSVKNPAADRAAAYGLPSRIVDGNDVEEVYRLAADLAAQARAGGGPSLVEAVTYRINGHSLFDPAKYRPKSEVEEWKARDPLKAQRARLEARGVSPGDLDRLEQRVSDEMANAVEEAKADPHVAADELLRDLWADGGAAWRS